MEALRNGEVALCLLAGGTAAIGSTTSVVMPKVTMVGDGSSRLA